MPDPLNVIVKFYDNFRFEPVDVGGIKGGGFGSGETTKLWHVDFSISQLHPQPENPEFCEAEFLEEQHFDEVRSAKYAKMKVHVVATGGTWKFKVKIGPEEFESAPVAYDASAAAIQAVIPSQLQPGPFTRFRHEEKGDGKGCPNSGGEEFGPERWIEVIDLGPSEWEFRFFANGGASQPNPLSWLATGVDLGPVIEMLPFWDEKEYFVPLEELEPGLEPPQSTAVPGGIEDGRHRSEHPVRGRSHHIP